MARADAEQGIVLIHPPPPTAKGCSEQVVVALIKPLGERVVQTKHWLAALFLTKGLFARVAFDLVY